MSNPSVSQCIHALHNSDIRARIQAVGELAAIGAPAMPALIACMNEANAEVRWRALVALGWIGDSKSVEPLLDALCDSAWEVRQSAAWALGQIGDVRAADGLLAAMRDHDEQVCVLAAYALARMKDHGRLQSCLNQAGERTSRAADAALSLLATEIELARLHPVV